MKFYLNIYKHKEITFNKLQYFQHKFLNSKLTKLTWQKSGQNWLKINLRKYKKLYSIQCETKNTIHSCITQRFFFTSEIFSQINSVYRSDTENEMSNTSLSARSDAAGFTESGLLSEK